MLHLKKPGHRQGLITQSQGETFTTRPQLILFGMVILSLVMGCAGPKRGRSLGTNNEKWHSSIKQAKSLGQPWEQEFGYAQGVRARDTLYLAGQMSLDRTGEIVGKGNMEAQFRQVYTNVKDVLTQYQATMQNVVEEVIFVTDISAARNIAAQVRKDVYAEEPQVATTLVQVDSLAFPEALVEIKVIAELQFLPRSRGGGDSDGGGKSGRGGRGSKGSRGGRGGGGGFGSPGI